MKATQSFFRTLLVLLVLLAAGQPAWASVTGTGTENDPYVVDNWADLKAKMAAGGYIRLGADVTDPDGKGDSYLEVPAGVSVTLDLNGHTIDRNMTESQVGGYVILLNGKSNNHASLTIRDGSNPSTGRITGGFDGNSGGNSAAGGINVQYGDLTLESGSICGNQCTFGGGGGVRLAGGTFTMTGGSITGNGVNTLENGAASAGGAIYGVSGDIYLRGGSITGNLCHGSSSYACSGIAHNYASGAAQLHLSGTFTLSDYLHGNREFIYLDGPINPTEPIAIDLYSGYNTQLTKNWSTHMGTAGADGCFTLTDNSESDGKVIAVIDDNLYIGTPEALYWGADDDHDGSNWEKAYIITTTDGLDLLAKQVNGTDGYTANRFVHKYFRLGKDITYSHKAANEAGADTENNFTAIGDLGNPFYGVFDGDGKTISGIRIYQPECDYQGIFGLGADMVKNVILCDAVITGNTNVGGIAGLCGNHTENCIVRDAIIKGVDFVGGIGGYSTQALKFCFVERTNVGGDHAGAIVGFSPSTSNVLHYNYYHSCTRTFNNNNTISIGIGTGAGDYSKEHGAEAVFTITTADPISITATKACRYQDVNYYSSPAVTISAPGYTILSASYNDGSSDHTITPNEGVYGFYMPSRDITISATLIVNATQDITAYAGTVSGVTRYWATFYNRTLNYRLPAGAQAFTMDADHHLCRVGTDGSIIPKNTPVVIIAEENALTGVSAASGTLTLTHTDSTAEINGTNILLGDGNPVTVTNRKVDGKTPYVLGIAHGVFGFHPFIASPIPAQKAYYLSAE